MIREEVQIEVAPGETVSAVLAIPSGFKPGVTEGLVIAHGAGGDLNRPLITATADGLCAAGYVTVRFNFLYREKGQNKPDSGSLRRSTMSAVCRYLTSHPSYSPSSITLVGKSIGGATAVSLAAENDGLFKAVVVLGYPLHRSGKPETANGAALCRIKDPMLLVVGTRDPLCILTALKSAMAASSSDWSLLEVEAGDHSYRLPEDSSKSRSQVHGEIVVAIRDWLVR